MSVTRCLSGSPRWGIARHLQAAFAVLLVSLCVLSHALSALAAPFAVKVKFQPSGGTVPLGFLADGGQTNADRGNGFTYGWSGGTPVMSSRDATGTSDPRATGANAALYLSEAEFASPVSWSIGLPNGTYTIKVVCGDAAVFGTYGVYTYQDQGNAARQMSLAGGTTTAANSWVEQTSTVSVTSGVLTLAPGSPGSGGQGRLNWVEITQIAPADVFVNFQSADALGMLGPQWRKDTSGARDTSVGVSPYNFGWSSSDSSGFSVAPDAVVSPVSPYNGFLYTTGVVAGARTWSIGLRNGAYSVHLVAGDASGVNMGHYQCAAQGQTVFDMFLSNGTAASHFADVTFTAQVTNGNLTLGLPAAPAADVKPLQLCFVEITGISSTPAPDIPAPGWASGTIPTDSSPSGGAAGPSSANAMNLASGVYENYPHPDITVHNASGPDAVFSRMYRSPLSAAGGYATPGLSSGWTNNYDVKIVTDASGNLTLKYPNGAAEAITPGGSGGGANLGTPYVVSGVAGTTAGRWASITIKFSDETSWIFTPVAGVATVSPGDPISDMTVASSAAGSTQISAALTGAANPSPVSGSATTPVYLLTKMANSQNQKINIIYLAGGSFKWITDDQGNVLLRPYTHSEGFSTSFQDADGRVVDYYYDTNKNLSSISAPYFLSDYPGYYQFYQAPQQFSYRYTLINGKYYLSSVTVPDPNGTNDAPPKSASNVITYDPALGFVTSVTDANSNKRSYTYNGGTSTKITVTDAANNVVETWTQNLNPNNTNAGTVDANGNTTQIGYGGKSQYLVTDYTNENGQKSHCDFDDHGIVQAFTDSRGVKTQLGYDPSVFGRLTSAQEGGLAPTTITYDPATGLPAVVTSPLPGTTGGGTVQTIYTYGGPLHNLQSVSIPPPDNSGQNVTYTYNYTSDGFRTGKTEALGEPLTVTDPMGHTTHFQYTDDNPGFGPPTVFPHNLIATIDDAGNQTDFVYNTANQLMQVIYPATGMTGNGRGLIEFDYAYPGGPLINTSVFDEGNPDFSSYNRGTHIVRQSKTKYGAESETTAYFPFLDIPFKYAYNPAISLNLDGSYRVKGIVDGRGATTTQNMDSVGDVTAFTYPLGDGMKFPSFQPGGSGGYDAAGNLLQRIDGKNMVTKFTRYADDSRLKQIYYATSPNPSVTLTHDIYSRITTSVDSAGTYTYSYDDLDNLLSVTTQYVGQSPQTISYTYFPNGQRATMTTPAGVFSYTYDKAGRMTNLACPASVGPGVSFGWSYYSNDWLQSQTASNGITTAYKYDGKGELTSQVATGPGGSVLSQYLGIQYDASGNRTQYTTDPNMLSRGSSQNGSATVFHYNDYDELNFVGFDNYQGGQVTHFGDPLSYDDAGNLYNKYNSQLYNANNQLTQFGGQTFRYDLNGNNLIYFLNKDNVVSDFSCTYDEEDRLVGNKPGIQVNSYRSDGLRAWWGDYDVPMTGYYKTYYLYDGTTPVVEMKNNQVVAVNTFGPTGLLHHWENRDVMSGLNATPYSLFYLFDLQGTTTARFDASGVAVAHTAGYASVYDSENGGFVAPSVFGGGVELGYPVDEHGFRSRSALDFDPYLGFAAQHGYWTDHLTGLILCTYRWYNSNTATWMTRDPESYDGGINLYAYCDGDPINNVDPLGFGPVEVRKKIHDLARGYIGSNKWQPRVRKAGSTDKIWGCNVFVHQVLKDAGVPVPIHVAGDWGNTKVTIPGWEVVPNSQAAPGDIVARRHISRDASGHMAIVDGRAWLGNALMWIGTHGHEGTIAQVQGTDGHEFDQYDDISTTHEEHFLFFHWKSTTTKSVLVAKHVTRRYIGLNTSVQPQSKRHPRRKKRHAH